MSVKDPNPFNRPDVWSLSASGATEAVTNGYVYDGSNVTTVPVVNTAGDLLTGYNKRRSELTMTMTGNRKGSPFSLAVDYVNKVNQYAWAHGAERTWLCTGFSASEETEAVGEEMIEYWKIRVSFAYNPDTWDLVAPNVGLNELAAGASGSVKRRVTVEDKDGNFVPSPKPVPLDASGAAKPAGQSADLLTFQVYKHISFVSEFGNGPL